MLRRSLRPLAVFVMMFLVLGGTPYGIEEIVPMSGPGMAIVVVVAMALFWAAPYALIVSELVSAMPLEGGLYPWFRVSVGPFWSFVFSYVDWLTWIMDSCLYPPLMAAYLLSFFTSGSSRWGLWAVCLIIIWVLTWLNVRGIDVVGRFSVGISVVVAIPLLIIVIRGWSRMSLAHLTPLVPDGVPVGTAMSHAIIWCMWTYSGYDAPANASEEIVEPEHNYPRLLALFLPLSILAHVLPLMCGLAVTPNWQGWKTAHFERVALALGGTGLAGLTALSCQFAGLGLFNGELLINSRRPYAMARDGLLPEFLARLHPLYQTPHVCLILQAVLYSVLTFFLTFAQLLTVSTWMSLPTYLLIFATPVLLRLKHPELRGRFRIPGGWPGLLFTAFCPSLLALYVLFHVEVEDMKLGLGLIALGPLLYLAAKWARRLSPHSFAVPRSH